MIERLYATVLRRRERAGERARWGCLRIGGAFDPCVLSAMFEGPYILLP